MGSTAHEQMSKIDDLFKSKTSPKQPKNMLIQLGETKEIVNKSTVKQVDENKPML